MAAKRRRLGLSSSFLLRAALDFVLYAAYTLALCNTAVFLCTPGHRVPPLGVDLELADLYVTSALSGF
eukprot:3233030-Pleurochrysis_carterae.AAC.2